MGVARAAGTVGGACMPVAIGAGVMFGTPGAMSAGVGISVSSDSEPSILRVREPAAGPVTGYIYDDGGTPSMEVKLDLYMDAPGLSITLSSHDLHSKQFSLRLKGPGTFLPDGRIAIAVKNVADVALTINVKVPIFGAGNVNLILPAGQMKLQLLSAPLRGALP